MSQQIMYSYGYNKRSTCPFNIALCDLHGETRNKLEKLHGFEAWPVLKETKPYIEVFPKDELVYLTADSSNTIHKLDPSKVYVVGGIVDRNRYKCLTFNKAKSQGIETAKLPIGEYLKLSSVRRTCIFSSSFSVCLIQSNSLSLFLFTYRPKY